jgi:signal recognition particle subunit SRP54
MLEKLSSGLQNIVKKLIKSGYVDEKLLDEIAKDLQRTLLEADVDVNLTFDLVKRIKERALKEKPLAGLTQKEHVVKVIYEELVKLVGKKPEILMKPGKILLIGLFGCGKTTTAGKLARWYQRKGLRVALVGCDIHRAAAMDQIEQIAKSLNVPYFISKETNDACEIARLAMEKLKKYDILIFDSAGRDALDATLAEELKKLAEVIKPDEVLLVVPADLGQAARKQAEEFSKQVGISGIIVTKLDGTAKGGGAITSCAVSGAPIKFIGFGEKFDAFSEFDPERFISRLIGFGDLQAILEKAKEVLSEEKAKTLKERIEEGKFTLVDFYEQIKAMQRMGPLKGILEAVPGLGMNIPKNLDLAKEEERIKKWSYIIDSMTKEERENPDIIDSSRIKRIAKGSGTKEEEVRELLRAFEQARKLMKMVSSKRSPLTKLMKRFGLGF